MLYLREDGQTRKSAPTKTLARFLLRQTGPVPHNYHGWLVGYGDGASHLFVAAAAEDIAVEFECARLVGYDL